MTQLYWDNVMSRVACGLALNSCVPETINQLIVHDVVWRLNHQYGMSRVPPRRRKLCRLGYFLWHVFCKSSQTYYCFITCIVVRKLNLLKMLEKSSKAQILVFVGHSNFVYCRHLLSPMLEILKKNTSW